MVSGYAKQDSGPGKCAYAIPRLMVMQSPIFSILRISNAQVISQGKLAKMKSKITLYTGGYGQLTAPRIRGAGSRSPLPPSLKSVRNVLSMQKSSLYHCW